MCIYRLIDVHISIFTIIHMPLKSQRSYVDDVPHGLQGSIPKSPHDPGLLSSTLCHLYRYLNSIRNRNLDCNAILN